VYCQWYDYTTLKKIYTARNKYEWTTEVRFPSTGNIKLTPGQSVSYSFWVCPWGDEYDEEILGRHFFIMAEFWRDIPWWPDEKIDTGWLYCEVRIPELRIDVVLGAIALGATAIGAAAYEDVKIGTLYILPLFK